MKNRQNTIRLAVIAMLCALAYVMMAYFRVPVVLFLKYDPKDIVIAIGGLIYGPLASFTISVVVSLIEFFAVSETGLWGLLMNILSSCSFACTAAFIYKKKRNLAGAVIGLLSGLVTMVGVMLLWNYLITPIYLSYPRETVAAMLLPAFLPFNLLKGGLNAAFTMLLYKPVITALRRARLLPQSEKKSEKAHFNIGVIIVALLVIVTCILFILSFRGII